MKKNYNIPIFVNHSGCKNDCVFCNQRKINGLETGTRPEEVKEIIDKNLSTIPEGAYVEAAFFGGSFTAIDVSKQKEYLEKVQKYIDAGRIKGIRISTRPDCISSEIIEMLKSYSVSLIELGVQSFEKKVLESTKRNHSVEDIYRSCRIIKDSGVRLGIQLMPGLPDSTFESDILGAFETVKIKPDVVRIYPTLIIKDTELETLYHNGRYRPLTMEEAVERTMHMTVILEKNGINIIRTGLMPSDELRMDGVVVAGPFHPSMKELVDGEIFYRFISQIIEEKGKVVVYCNKKDISKIRGLNKRNIERLAGNADVIENNDIPPKVLNIGDKDYSRGEIIENIYKQLKYK